MAEIVGVVACSVELTKTLLDLKRLYTAIKDAPKEVVSLLEDTDRTNRVLHLAVEQQQQIAPFLTPRPEWAECRQSCRATAGELSDIVSSLHREIRKNRSAGSLKYTFKKDTITALRQRLESAKSTLCLAEHAFNR